MRVNIKFPGLRMHNEPLHAVYVAKGDGHRPGIIKTDYFAINKEPGMVKLEWEHDGSRRARVSEIRMRPDLADAGYLIVEEEYRKEGNEAGWELFKRFQDAARKGQVRVDESMSEDPCPGFPTERLPKSVQALYEGGRKYWSADDGLARELSSNGGDGASNAEAPKSRRKSE